MFWSPYGYLLLAESLYNSDDNQIPSAFNFGPTENVSATVIDLINTSRMYWQLTALWKCHKMMDIMKLQH